MSKNLQENHWIPLGDMMAGFVAVILIFFVIAAVRVANDARAIQDMKKADRRTLENVMKTVDDSISSFIRETGMVIDKADNTIRLPADKTFARGSADLTKSTETALTQMAKKLISSMEKFPRLRILVEGHADSSQVTGRLSCGADDNYTLSAFRARNARKVLLDSLGDEYSKRVGIAAYGDSRPLVSNLMDSANRRVEIRFEVTPEKPAIPNKSN
jgi:chemotaxis protein MotB